MPEIVFDTLDAVPEGFREVASQKDGKFTVNVVAANKLAEFRDNNISLARERDGLKAYHDSLAGIVGEDPASFMTSYGELQTIAQKVKDGTLKGSDAVQAEVAQRVAQMKADYERQLAQQAQDASTWKSKASENDTKWRRSIVDRQITEAVISDASGALPSALSDILTRAYRVFKVTDDNKLIARDGEAVIYGADGTTPMSPLEWLAKLRESAPYFFKGSNGGGATGAANAGGGLYGGMSLADFQKLAPEAKLALAHRLKQGKK
jgi:hypothetical protein